MPNEKKGLRRKAAEYGSVVRSLREGGGQPANSDDSCVDILPGRPEAGPVRGELTQTAVEGGRLGPAVVGSGPEPHETTPLLPDKGDGWVDPEMPQPKC